MTYSNCLIWAVWQRVTKGGKITYRQSQYTLIPHFMWTKDGKTLSYCPLYPKYKPIPPPLFRGYVKEE